MRTIILLFMLMSCATPYQKKGLRGGYSDKRLSSDTYIVTFTGNGYTPGSTAELYLYKRAAEIARENGYQYFVVLNGANHGGIHVINNQVTNKHDLSATIKLLRETDGYNAYDASSFSNID